MSQRRVHSKIILIKVTEKKAPIPKENDKREEICLINFMMMTRKKKKRRKKNIFLIEG